MTKPYRPSNGSEGLLFQHRYCNRCIHDKSMRQEPFEGGCSVWYYALVYKVDEPEYPSELVYADPDDRLSGTCTKFTQDPDEPESAPRTFPLPSEILGAYLGGTALPSTPTT